MRRPLSAIILLFVLLLSLALFLDPVESPDLSAWNKSAVTLTGRVEEKEWKRSNTTGGWSLRITLKDLAVEDEDFPDEALNGALCDVTITEGKFGDYERRFTSLEGAKVDLSDPDLALTEETIGRFSSFEDAALPMGAKVRLSGTLYEISPATNHGEFDATGYYASLGISFRVLDCRVLAVEKRRGIKSYCQDALYRLRRRLCRCLEACLPAEDASLLEAMLLGQKGLLDAETKERYQMAGIIHVICISGLHIGILASALFELLRARGVKKNVAMVPSFLLALAYGLFTGMAVSALRAVIMFGISCGGKILLRSYDIVTAGAIAAGLILITQPLYLLNTGFLFSFAAVLGIGLFGPVLKNRFLSILTIPLATLPVYLGNAQSFPVYAIFLNLLILPLMSGLLILGIVVLAFAFLFPAAAPAAALPVHFCLRFFDVLCGIAGSLPGHSASVGYRGAWQIGLYLVLLFVLVLFQDDLPMLVRGLWVCACVLLLLVRISTGLSIHYVDVGQGDGILITCEDTVILLDGGSTSKTDVGKYQLQPVLEYYGIEKIDYCILSHEDMDHMNGAYSLIANACTHEDLSDVRFGEWESTDTGIAIGCVLLGDVKREAYSENEQLLLKAAKEKHIPVGYLSAGESIEGKGFTLTCLHPRKREVYEEANNGSVTLLLKYGAFSALFTGDLETGDAEDECLEYLAQRTDLFPQGSRLTVLKSPHHGSSNGGSEKMLNQLKPCYAVISCGVDNRYGHPHKETLERLNAIGAKILDTRYEGEITVWTNGKKVRVSSCR